MIFEWLIYAWRTPNAFRDSWRKYGLNQAGHGMTGLLVGSAASLIEGSLAFFAASALLIFFYTMWEYTQWQYRRAEASDGFEDWAFVYTCYAVGVTHEWAILPGVIAYLLGGIYWRLEPR